MRQAWLVLCLAIPCGAIAASLWPRSFLYLALPFCLCVGLLAVSLGAWGLFGKNSARRKATWLITAASLAALLFGASLFLAAVEQQQNQMLAAACDGAIVTADFEVLELVESQGQQQRFWLRSDSPSLANCFAALPATMRLSYWQRTSPPQFLREGSRFSAEVKLRRPHSSVNPGGFDYRAWLWRQNAGATGYIRELVAVGEPLPRSLRGRLRSHIDRLLTGHPAKGLVEALSIGYRANISDLQWRHARETGLAHLLAISGLHLGLVAGFFSLVFAGLSRLLPRERGWPPLLSLGPALLAAALYATLAGWPLSTQRAWLMLAIFVVAGMLNWRTPSFLAWAVAALLCVLWQPLNVLDAGFYLSFAAVALLLWFGRSAAGKTNFLGMKVFAAFKLQLLLLLGMLPLQLWFFGGASLLALPMNLLLVPLLALFLLPALLIICFGLLMNIGIADAALLLLADALQVFQSFVTYIHGKAAGQWFAWQIIGQPPIFQYLVLIVALLLFALPRGLGLRSASLLALIAAILCLLVVPTEKYERGEFSLTAFDAGQGTALLLQTRNHRLIYDTAAAWRGGGSAMQSMILPAMANLGIDSIDEAVISHSDNDHAGGLPALRAQYGDFPVLGSQQKPCTQGLKRQFDGVSIEALWPIVGPNDSNDSSCVLRISSRYGSALLTGDISRSVERKLLADGSRLEADWLLVPHHGSKSSSSEAFIKAVRPSVAVITSGYNNRYHLPAAEVTQRYKQLLPHLSLLNTAHSGAVTANFKAQCRPCLVTEDQRKRWWQ